MSLLGKNLEEEQEEGDEKEEQEEEEDQDATQPPSPMEPTNSTCKICGRFIGEGGQCLNPSHLEHEGGSRILLRKDPEGGNSPVYVIPDDLYVTLKTSVNDLLDLIYKISNSNTGSYALTAANLDDLKRTWCDISARLEK